MTLKIEPKKTRFHGMVGEDPVLYEVTRKLGRDVWEATVVNEPVTFEGQTFDSDYAGRKDSFTTRRIQEYLAMEERAQASRDRQTSFYESLTVGQIVHYNNGFNEYVRCEVVIAPTDKDPTPHKTLKPIALLGRWSEWSSSTRYHREKIREGTCWEAHASCIYESPHFVRRADTLNPADLPTLSPDPAIRT